MLKKLLILLLFFVGGMIGITAQTDRYASHSVLTSGHWAKIRILATGYYELTDSLLALAGMNDAAGVKVYGYGGAWQPHALQGDYLKATDDLHEVPLCVLGDGRRLFFGVGPVNWESATALPRVRNPYSDYGYYFVTDSHGAPQLTDSASFFGSHYPHPNDYHALYEVDSYSWYSGGYNLYDGRLFGQNVSHSYQLPAYSQSGKLLVRMSYDNYCDAEVLLNDSLLGHITVEPVTEFSTEFKAFPDKYSVAAVDSWTFDIPNGLHGENTVVIRQLSGANMRLDFLSLQSDEARPLDSLLASCPVPEYVSTVTSQDLHADGAADMVIIIPTNRILMSQAERLAALHRDMDSMRVNIVVADQLYNEFSSGTPDANAYRRYLKMLYDRAETTADKPRFLVLLGDGAWDNRLTTDRWKAEDLDADELLLCYESDNSFSKTRCYVTDDFFCMLDDGEGANLLYNDIGDMAVGRLPARTEAQAKVMVDKIISYRKNTCAGSWQNTLFFMGDDGDKNRHMRDAEVVVDKVTDLYPAYQIKKIYWDAYKMTSSSSGNRYPDVTTLIKDQMRQGALVMNYTGHGSPTDFAHEYVMRLPDFKEATSMRWPLWVTASCDIMPFDGLVENIGEAAMCNPKGGAIAFFGTMHTVYANKNMPINRAFMKYVLGTKDGRRITIGEAARMAKTEMIDSLLDLAENKLQYGLLGDPALTLATPTLSALIDSINGQPVTAGIQQLPVGKEAVVSGYISDNPDFNGVATLTVKDAEVHEVCRKNNWREADNAFEFDHRPNTVITVSDSVRNGRFRIKLTVPLDISYADGVGQMLIYTVNNDHTLTAHGESFDFTMGGGELSADEAEGPTIDCYLDYKGFQDGGLTSSTPFFYAKVYDADGINVSGNGIGHDMELIIDGSPLYSYNLNDYFVYDLGDYRRGEVGFTIPRLPDGEHRLLFRAWDIYNHSATAEVTFQSDIHFVASGIRNIVNDEWFSRRREQLSGDVYDASGRFVGHQVPMRPGLYIFKSNRGIIKKIMVKGNK